MAQRIQITIEEPQYERTQDHPPKRRKTSAITDEISRCTPRYLPIPPPPLAAPHADPASASIAPGTRSCLGKRKRGNALGAIHRAFNIAELRECILSFLPTRSIIGAQRSCRAFRASYKDSPTRLQIKTFEQIRNKANDRAKARVTNEAKEAPTDSAEVDAQEKVKASVEETITSNAAATVEDLIFNPLLVESTEAFADENDPNDIEQSWTLRRPQGIRTFDLDRDASGKLWMTIAFEKDASSTPWTTRHIASWTRLHLLDSTVKINLAVECSNWEDNGDGDFVCEYTLHAHLTLKQCPIGKAIEIAQKLKTASLGFDGEDYERLMEDQSAENGLKDALGDELADLIEGPVKTFVDSGLDA